VSARAVCERCVVRSECTAFALELGTRFGVWGGLSERERRRLRLAEANSALARHHDLVAEVAGVTPGWLRLRERPQRDAWRS
jgi:hypothetical protein